MFRIALVLSIGLLTGCNQTCFPPPDIFFEELDPAIIGNWTGIAETPVGSVSVALTVDTDGSLHLSFDQDDLVYSGIVATHVGSEYDFVNFGFECASCRSCTDFNPGEGSHISQGIYLLHEDGRLEIATLGADNGPRPTNFQTVGIYMELQRVDTKIVVDSRSTELGVSDYLVGLFR